MIRLAVAGAVGRMGRCLLELANGDEEFEVAAALTSPGCSLQGKDLTIGHSKVSITNSLNAPCDVLIDFSTPSGTMAWLEVCLKRALPIVIGATGHDHEQIRQIKEAAHHIPVIHAPNCSIGIQTILSVLGAVVRSLGQEYDVEIVETHHRHKTDVPSGTAIAFVDEIGLARGRDGRADMVNSRQTQGARKAHEIGVHSVRMGDVVGRHEIHLSGPGETITLQHEAHSRNTFAAGALRAARWVVGRGAGWYTMRDVLE